MRAAALLALSVLSLACSDPAPSPSVVPFDAAARDVAQESGTSLLDAAADLASLDVSDDAPSRVDASAVDVPGADAATTDVARGRLRVLFVGNSYTYVNDLPGLVTRMGAAASRAGVGPEIVTDNVTVGGATLHNHWDTNTAPMRIMAGGWDAVVLQGQSVEPVLAYADFRTYAVRFGMLASTYGARAVYYATWPRRAGDDVYTQSWSGGTPEVLGMRLHTAYTQVAALAGGSVAPVGNAWMAALRGRPSIELYASDGSHPSPAGTWLAGCVMYRALVGRAAPVETESAVTDVPMADARYLRELSAMVP